MWKRNMKFFTVLFPEQLDEVRLMGVQKLRPLKWSFNGE